MKLDLTKILLILSLLFIGWQGFFSNKKDVVQSTVSVIVPEVKGTTGIIPVEPRIIRDTIFLKGDVIEVDKGYKKLYEDAIDSLEKKEIFLKAIEINKYSDTLVDNKEIIIKGEATTRGSLLNYSVDYTIKEKEFTYTPEVIKVLPRLTAGLGLELGVPTVPNISFVAKANLSLMNNKGREVSVGYDTENRVWIGGKLNIKLIK